MIESRQQNTDFQQNIIHCLAAWCLLQWQLHWATHLTGTWADLGGWQEGQLQDEQEGQLQGTLDERRQQAHRDCGPCEGIKPVIACMANVQCILTQSRADTTKQADL